jgi:hypothetical protein
VHLYDGGNHVQRVRPAEGDYHIMAFDNIRPSLSLDEKPRPNRLIHRAIGCSKTDDRQRLLLPPRQFVPGWGARWVPTIAREQPALISKIVPFCTEFSPQWR